MRNVDDIKLYGKTERYPIIRDESLEVLVGLVRDIAPDNILEIGTAIGYSGCLMLNNCNANLTTIELNPDTADIARQNFADMEFASRVKILVGDAGNIINIIDEKFDLIFLDGAKAQYVKYLPTLYTLLNTGGYLVADNVLFRGYVRGDVSVPRRYKTIAKRMKMFLEKIENNGDWETRIFDVGDGVSVSKKL